MQTISGRIFELLKERNVSQKTFAQKTGIAESTISDWKKKKIYQEQRIRDSEAVRVQRMS